MECRLRAVVNGNEGMFEVQKNMDIQSAIKILQQPEHITTVEHTVSDSDIVVETFSEELLEGSDLAEKTSSNDIRLVQIVGVQDSLGDDVWIPESLLPNNYRDVPCMNQDFNRIETVFVVDIE